MAPTRKKHEKCNNEESLFIFTSPICDLHVLSCKEGLHHLHQHHIIDDEHFTADVNKQVVLEGSEKEAPPPPIVELHHWLEIYFSSPDKIHLFSLPQMCPLSPENTGFFYDVWRFLSTSVPLGSVITYGQLAQQINKPGAARAVGTAMRTNPLSLIIPCHRVVSSSGLGSYGGGTRQKVKLWLLNHEGISKFNYIRT